MEPSSDYERFGMPPRRSGQLAPVPAPQRRYRHRTSPEHHGRHRIGKAFGSWAFWAGVGAVASGLIFHGSGWEGGLKEGRKEAATELHHQFDPKINTLGQQVLELSGKNHSLQTQLNHESQRTSRVANALITLHLNKLGDHIVGFNESNGHLTARLSLEPDNKDYLRTCTGYVSVTLNPLAEIYYPTPGTASGAIQVTTPEGESEVARLMAVRGHCLQPDKVRIQ